MKKLLLVMVFSLGLLAKEDCEKYLEKADGLRAFQEERYLSGFGTKEPGNNTFSSERALTILAYQDRYKICVEIEKKGK